MAAGQGVGGGGVITLQSLLFGQKLSSKKSLQPFKYSRTTECEAKAAVRALNRAKKKVKPDADSATTHPNNTFCSIKGSAGGQLKTCAHNRSIRGFSSNKS